MMTSTGWRKGQINLLVSSRRTGKSNWAAWSQMINDLTLPNVKLIESAQVDQETWHTVQLSYPVADWIRTQSNQLWVELTEGCFDVHESLYTMLMLKWK